MPIDWVVAESGCCSRGEGNTLPKCWTHGTKHSDSLKELAYSKFWEYLAIF